LRSLLGLLLGLAIVSNVSGQLTKDTFDVSIYNKIKDFSFSSIQDVDVDSRGYIWISMINQGLLRINQNEGRKYGYQETGRTRNDVLSFYENEENQIFLGREVGIDQYDFESDSFKKIAESSFSTIPHYATSIFAMLQIPGGKYLLASRSGVHVFNLEQDTIEQVNITGSYTVDASSSNKHTYNLVLDEKRNAVWCTSRSGLVKINLSDFTTEKIECPFHKDGSWPEYLMDDIFLHKDELFISLRHRKILSYNIPAEKWDVAFHLRFEEYLESNKVRQDSFDLYLLPMTSYNDRYLIIPSTRMGLFIYDMANKKPIKPYLKHEMFKDIHKFEDPKYLAHRYASETYFGVVDKYGYLWATEIRELMIKTQEPIFALQEQAPLYDIQISQILVDNRPVEKSFYYKDDSKFGFKKYERDITLKFDLVNPPFENYELQYAVNGSEFKPCFNKSLAILNQLSGGENEIVMRALFDEKVVQTKTVQLEIEKEWYEKWTNRMLMLVLFLGILFGIYWAWMSRIREKAALETEYNKKIAEVKMAAFRSQMNPHFMFNSLNSINQFIVKMEPQKASEYLSKFSRLMRQVLSNSTSQLVNLEADIEALSLYLDMEGLRFGDKFDYEIKIEKDIDGKDCLVPPLLIQPYVENAIWHGIMPLDGGGRLTVHVAMLGEHIKISIEDNGIGRVKSLKINKNKIVKTKSMGMEITKNRLSLIESVYNLKTELKITDKYDGDQATGTLVELIMPYLSHQKINTK